jgi:hypothetical protein
MGGTAEKLMEIQAVIDQKSLLSSNRRNPAPQRRCGFELADQHTGPDRVRAAGDEYFFR